MQKIRNFIQNYDFSKGNCGEIFFPTKSRGGSEVQMATHVGQLLDLGVVTFETRKMIPQIIPHYSLVIPAYKRQKRIDMITAGSYNYGNPTFLGGSTLNISNTTNCRAFVCFPSYNSI